MVAKYKTWTQAVSGHLKRYKTESDRILAQHRAEVKRKKLTTPQANHLWRTKYVKPFKVLEKKMDRDYKRIWDKYNKLPFK